MNHSKDGRGGSVNRSTQLRMIGLSLIILFFFLSLAIDSKLLDGIDVQALILINSAHTEVLDPVMVALSLYGREVVWGTLGIGLFIFGGEKERKTALTLGLIILVLLGVSYVTKAFYSRPRPYDAIDDVRLLVAKGLDSSYPSGHTLTVAGGVVVAWLSLRKTWAVILFSQAALVAYSRIYVGVHYPFDVLGGALLGAGFALIFCSDTRIVDWVYLRLPARLRKK